MFIKQFISTFKKVRLEYKTYLQEQRLEEALLQELYSVHHLPVNKAYKIDKNIHMDLLAELCSYTFLFKRMGNPR